MNMLRVICGLWLVTLLPRAYLQSDLSKRHTCRFFHGDGNAEKVSIWRFMVDQHYQKMGIGRAALHLALNEIKPMTK